MAKLRKSPRVPLKPMSSVYISTGNGKLRNVLLRGFDALGGIQKVVRPGQSVLLKINLVGGNEAISGGVTDVHMCEAVIELLKEFCQPGRIVVGEQTDINDMTKLTFQRNGYVDMCARQEVELLDFGDDEFVDVPIEDALYAEVVSVPKTVLDVDVFITLAMLKNHDTVCVTGAVKNSFGFVPDPDRRQAHRDTAIEQYLVDLARVRLPDFAIIDGRIGMEGIAGGSHFDHPRYANRIIMGADAVAVDTVCAHIMEQNPRVRYLQWADQMGLGNCNLDYIDIHGMPLEEAKVHFMTPGEEHEERTEGKLHLIDLHSCSQCRAVAQGTLHRYDAKSIINPVDIVYGPYDWDVPEDRAERCVLIGDCIQERYRSLGTWIPGCPMNVDKYMEALRDLGVTCSKCVDLVREFLARHTEDELAFLRILAASQTVFRGRDNKAGSLDSALIIGDCEEYYAWMQNRRVESELAERGLEDQYSPEDFVCYMPGCDITLEQMEEAYQQLKARRPKL